MKDAAAGLPVSGRIPTWENSRPSKLSGKTAQKPRGFIDYERITLPYRSEKDRIKDWNEVLFLKISQLYIFLIRLHMICLGLKEKIF